jgi:hypothetical protein
LVLVAAVGCGRDGGPDTEAQAGSAEPSVDTVGMVGIEAVESSDERSITVRTEPVPVEAADGSCRAEVTPRADEHGGESAMIDVSVDVRADRPQLGDPATRDENGFVVTWEGCELAPRTVVIELEHPVGRPVHDPFGSQFWLQDGRWVGCDHIVMTCIVDPASCDNSTLRDTIANADVPRHFGMGNSRCEEPFAVVDVDVGAGACPVTGDPTDNPCAGENIRRLYFRIDADAAAWTVAGSDPGPGCGTITATIPDFPTHLCHDLPALDGGR